MSVRLRKGDSKHGLEGTPLCWVTCPFQSWQTMGQGPHRLGEGSQETLGVLEGGTYLELGARWSRQAWMYWL